LGATLACCLLEVLDPQRDAATGRRFVALFEQAASVAAFRRWGVLGDRSVADLWVETDAAFARFHIDIL